MKIGFIGCGSMARAIVTGWLKVGALKGSDVMMSDVSSERLSNAADDFGVGTTRSNIEVLNQSDLVFLAVKPQMMAGLLAEISAEIMPNHHLVSMAAGLPLSFYQENITGMCPVSRIMPNTPMQVAKGVCGVVFGENIVQERRDELVGLLSTIAQVHVLDEGLLDRITGISGSGPAYVYMAIEALADGAIKVGIPSAMAFSLAAQTVLGSAQMVLDSGKHPAELKNQVTSPGGTTIEGVYHLERQGLRAALIGAVEASVEKARDMSRGK